MGTYKVENDGVINQNYLCMYARIVIVIIL